MLVVSRGPRDWSAPRAAAGLDGAATCAFDSTALGDDLAAGFGGAGLAVSPRAIASISATFGRPPLVDLAGADGALLADADGALAGGAVALVTVGATGGGAVADSAGAGASLPE